MSETPSRADLERSLEVARQQFAFAEMIDNYSRMQEERARWGATISRLEAKLEALDAE